MWFDYWLADRLKMTVREVREMDNSELLHWQMYHAHRRQQEELARKRGSRGGH